MRNSHTSNLKIILAAGFSTLLYLIHPLANAQSDTDMREAVENCQNIEDLSARLFCYDQAFPPEESPAAPGQAVQPSQPAQAVVPPRAVETPQRNETMAPRQEYNRAVSEAQLAYETSAQIIAVETPNIRAFHLTAADGRVFSQTRLDRTVQLPETPFNVEIETGLFGSTFIKLSPTSERIRVTVEY